MEALEGPGSWTIEIAKRSDAAKVSIGVEYWLWRKLGAGLRGRSCSSEQASLEKIQLCAAIHLSLHQFQLRVLPLGLAI
jgi:hypothetical protein